MESLSSKAFATHPSFVQLALLILAAIVTVSAIRRNCDRDSTERKGCPLPPGPTPLPLLGSSLSVGNAQKPWLLYTEWQKKYGDLIRVRLLDSNMIVLNSYSDAAELLEKRSQMYSDRPFIATVKAYGHGINCGFSQYGPHWRLCRRIIHQTFRAEAARAFHPMQLRRARQIVLSIIDDPNGYPACYSTFAAAVAMSAVYDYEPEPRDDPMVAIVNDFCKSSFPSLTLEKSVILRAFPFLPTVPKWIPVLSWISRETSKALALSAKMAEVPYQWILRRMEANEDVVADTMVVDHTRRMEKMQGSHRAEYEAALKQACATSFLASAETTSSTLMTFTLAMVKNARIWKCAQAEIDAVIGTERLPEYEDRPSLPYVDAIVRETWRWYPVAPLGVPHAVTSSDIYKGYYIPAGTSILPNVWAMTRDEARYPDPEMFFPERFLDSQGALNEDDPADFVFGFGRRICPGRYTADASVWIGIATMLAALDFNTAKDANGIDIEFEARFVNGITHYPLFFPCNLVPRAHIDREVLQRSLAK